MNEKSDEEVSIHGGKSLITLYMDKPTISLPRLHRTVLATHYLLANKEGTSSQTTFISVISLRLPNGFKTSIRPLRKKQTRSLDGSSRAGNNAVGMHFPWTEIREFLSKLLV